MHTAMHRPRRRRRAADDRRILTPGHVRLRLDGYRPVPCPITPHAGRAAPHAGIDRPTDLRCRACHDHGQIWLHQDLLATPGARGRLTHSIREDARAGRWPLGLGLLGDEAVYGHHDAVPPA